MKQKIINKPAIWNRGDILAFVHLEKAAGTTFIHILRHNFLMQYLDVRPFSPKSQGQFLNKDYQIARRILPGLRCLGGHSVKPYLDLHLNDERIKYITIFRDPAKRYVSQYEYWTDRLGKKLSFEEFLQLDETRNFQTRKIAGSEDFDKAINILEKQMLLIGFVEKYDEFLVLLKNKLAPESFDPRYKRLNEGRKSVSAENLLKKHKNQIEEINNLDMKLYQYVMENIYPHQIESFPGDIEKALREFQEWNIRTGPIMWPRYTDFVFRKVYLEPVTGGLRILNRLPYKGSY